MGQIFSIFLDNLGNVKLLDESNILIFAIFPESSIKTRLILNEMIIMAYD